MFLDDKPQGEVTEAPARTLKLSDGIRNGHSMIAETRHAFLGDCYGCALGAAWVAAGKTVADKEHFYGSDFVQEVAKIYGVPPEIVFAVHRRHFLDKHPRLQIADWLEAQGL